MKKKRLQRSDKFWLAAVSLLVLLQFWWLPGNPGTPDDTYSNTVVGKRGLFQTMEELSEAGLLPSVRRDSEGLIPRDPSTLVIISPDRYPNDIEEGELATFVRNGNTLVFAPRWQEPECSIGALLIRVEEQPEYEFSTVSATPVQTPAPASRETSNKPDTLQAEAEDRQQGSELNTSVPPVTIPAPNSGQSDVVDSDSDSPTPAENVENAIRQQASVPGELRVGDDESVLEGANLEVQSALVGSSVQWRTRADVSLYHGTSTILVESSNGSVQAATWPLGSGHIVVAASPDVFSNSSMLRPGQAELAVRLVEHAHHLHPGTAGNKGVGSEGPAIVFSEYLNTSEKYHGTAVLISPGLRSGTLQLILVAVLAGWFGFHRFGPLEQHDHNRRRSLAESAAAVGNLHFRTHNGAEAVNTYMAYMTAQLRRHFGSLVDLRNPDAIAARAGLPEDDVADAIASASALVARNDTSTPAAGAAIRRLSRILDQAVSGQSRTSSTKSQTPESSVHGT